VYYFYLWWTADGGGVGRVLLALALFGLGGSPFVMDYGVA